MMVSNRTENYLRLLLLNAEGATPVLRETLVCFIKKTSKKKIGIFLMFFKDLFKLLKAKRILNETDYNKLLKGPAVDINDWDTSLLCFVLLNCCTLNGKMYEHKTILLKEAKNDLDTFLLNNKSAIDKYKRKGRISEEQYKIMFPNNNSTTDLQLWDTELSLLIGIKVCSTKVKNTTLDVLKGQIQNEMDLKNSNVNLTDFLDFHNENLKNLKSKGKFNSSQFNEIFPRSGPSDVNKWDSHTLSTVVLYCTSSLGKDTIEAIQTIRSIRNKCLAHRKDADMGSTEYQPQSVKLTDAINTIITSEQLSIKDKIDSIVDTVLDGPIDMRSTMCVLKEYYIKDSSESTVILQNLDKVETHMGNIERKLDGGFQQMNDGFARSESNSKEVLRLLSSIEQKMPSATYSSRSEIKCVDMIIAINSETETGRLKAEDIIQSAIKQAGDNSTEQIQAALGVIRQIVNEDGRTIVEIKKGSIVLTIKCISLKGLHRLLQYVASVEIISHLKQLSCAITDFIGESININVCLSESTVLNACEDAVRILSSYIDNTISLRMTIRAETVEELQRMLDEFKGDSVKSQLQSLSEGLSTYLGEDINVDVVVPQINISCDTLFTSTVTEIPQQHENICAEEIEDNRGGSRISVSEIPQQQENTCAEEVQDTRGGSRISESRMMVGMLEEELADVCMDDKYISNDKVSEIPKKRTKICEEENEDTQEIYKTTKVQKITRGDIHFESRMTVKMLEEALADVCMDDKYISNDKVSEIPKKRTKICEEENEDTQEIYKTTKVQKITRGDIHFESRMTVKMLEEELADVCMDDKYISNDKEYIGRGGDALPKTNLLQIEQTEQTERLQFEAKYKQEILDWKRELTYDYNRFLKENIIKKVPSFHDINMLFVSVSRYKTVADDFCKLSDILRGGCKTSVVDTHLPLVGVPITMLAILQDWINSQEMPTEKMNGQQKFLNTFDLLLVTDEYQELPIMTIIGKCLIIKLDNLDHDLRRVYSYLREDMLPIKTHPNMKMKPLNQTNLSTISLLNLCSEKPKVESYFYMAHAHNATKLIIQEIPTSSTNSNTYDCDTGRIKTIVFLNKRIDESDLSLMRYKEVNNVHFHNCELSCFKGGEPSSKTAQHSYENIESIVLSDMQTETDVTCILKAINLIQMTITGNIKSSSFQFPITKTLKTFEIYNISGPKGCAQSLINSLLSLMKLNRLVLRNCESREDEFVEFQVMETLNNLLIEDMRLNEKSTTALMKSLPNLTGMTELTLQVKLSNVYDEALEFPVMHTLTSLVIKDMDLHEKCTTELMKSLSNLTSLTDLTIQELRYVNYGGFKFPVMDKLTSLVITNLAYSSAELMKSLSYLTGLTKLTIQEVSYVSKGGLKFPVMDKLTFLVITYMGLNKDSTTELMNSLSNLTCLTELTIQELRYVSKGDFKFPVMDKLTSLVIKGLSLNEKSSTELMKSLSNLTSLTKLTLGKISGVNDRGLEFPIMDKLTSLVVEDMSFNEKSTMVLMKSLSNITSLTKFTLNGQQQI